MQTLISEISNGPLPQAPQTSGGVKVRTGASMLAFDAALLQRVIYTAYQDLCHHVGLLPLLLWNSFKAD